MAVTHVDGGSQDQAADGGEWRQAGSDQRQQGDSGS